MHVICQVVVFCSCTNKSLVGFLIFINSNLVDQINCPKLFVSNEVSWAMRTLGKHMDYFKSIAIGEVESIIGGYTAIEKLVYIIVNVVLTVISVALRLSLYVDGSSIHRC